MAGGSSSSNPPKQRKRVEADTPESSSAAAATLSIRRAKDGSAFSRWYCYFLFPLSLIARVLVFVF